MSISMEEVNRIAKLARLSFNDDQKQKLQQELSAILDYVDQLKQVSALGGQDSDPGQVSPESVNLMRPDVAEQVSNPEEFLAQAQAREGNFIKVKSVLE